MQLIETRIGAREWFSSDESMVDRVVEKDVLVIGGGVAGMASALQAFDLGADVLLVTKSLVGKSGCSIESRHFLGIIPNIGLEKSIAALTDPLVSLADPRLTEKLLREIYDRETGFARWLEEIGVAWERNDDGSLKICDYGIYRTVASPHWGVTGKAVSDVLRSEVARRRIDTMEETMVIDLLKNNEGIVGAVALNYVNGDILVAKAKSVILAAGGHMPYKYGSYTRECRSSDGYAVAVRAGAKLVNIEMFGYHWFDQLRPIWEGGEYPVGLLMNLPSSGDKQGRDDRYFPKYYDLNGEIPECQDNIEPPRRVKDWILWKRGVDKGGYYIGFDHIDDFQEKLKIHQYMHYQYLRKLGRDKQKRVEAHITVHNPEGGVFIDEMGGTTLPGLYAAGAVTGVIGVNLARCIGTAMWSAGSASKRAKEIDMPEVDWEQVDRTEKKVLSFAVGKINGGFRPHQVRMRIHEIMYNNVGVVKNKNSLEEALRELQFIKRNIMPKMYLMSDTKAYNIDRIEALEVNNMFLLSEITTRASLIRKESRFEFLRSDYPATDNKNWLKWLVVRLENEDIKISIEDIPRIAGAKDATKAERR